MALYGLILFVIYGWVEFEAMAVVVDAIGGLLGFLGIFATAIIGIHLLRSQSAQIMGQFRSQLAQGQLNSDAIASSLSLLLGAILMLLPGYVTDFMGLLCFLPGLRVIIGRFLASKMAARQASAFSAGPFGGDNAFEDFLKKRQNDAKTTSQTDKDITFDESGEIIEGEFKEKN